METTCNIITAVALTARLAASIYEVHHYLKYDKELSEKILQNREMLEKMRREKILQNQDAAEEEEILQVKKSPAEMMIENVKEKMTSIEEKMRKMQENILEKAPCHSFNTCMWRFKRSLFLSNI